MAERWTVSSQLHRIATGLAEAGWLAAVVLVPLAVNPWGFNYELPKVALFRGLALLEAAAHLLAYAAFRGFRYPEAPSEPGIEIGRWLRRPLVRPILLVAGVVLLSALTSLSPLVIWYKSASLLQPAWIMSASHR